MHNTRAFRNLFLLVFAALVQSGAHAQQFQIPLLRGTLPDARRGFVTKIVAKRQTILAPPKPPRGFQLVEYAAPLGSYPAYLTVPEETGKRYPAIIWLMGGFDNSIGDTPWRSARLGTDQSAKAFREAGIITMYPSLRGGNNNAGYIETDMGEVDDVLAAAEFLAAQPNVDPSRIYLGGHSTGGTLALLVDEMLTTKFRAVFAFGPGASAGSYGTERIAFDIDDRMELALRSPIGFLNTIQAPTFVFEGDSEPSNSQSLHQMSKFCKNPIVHFYDLPGVNHFSGLAPTTKIIAEKIIADTSPKHEISFADEHLTIVPLGP